MTTLRLPWAPIQARGEIAVVLVATPETRASGGLTTDGYAQAERLGSHLRGRLDGLWCADNPGARQVARCMETPEVGPSVAHGLRLTAPPAGASPRARRPRGRRAAALPGANSQPGELQVIGHGELILRCWRRPSASRRGAARRPPGGLPHPLPTQEGRWALSRRVDARLSARATPHSPSSARVLTARPPRRRGHRLPRRPPQ